MRISLTQPFFNADDSPATDAATKKVMDLRWSLTQICLHEIGADGQPLRGEAKVKRYDLYRKIKKAGEVISLTAEEISLLKDGALAFPTLVAGQTREMLENEAPSPVAAVAERPSDL